ncbi:MAG: hypothetical protein JO097_19115 [Acidobacteriaceae bacterium]|nr:hypothetical protein [Acidobacteriaceae bacterium]
MLKHIRAVVAVSVLGACVLVATVQHLGDTYLLDFFRDMSSQVESLRKPADIAKQLVFLKEDIGYISDENEAESLQYYGLQYQILPSVVVPSPGPRVVICHLHNPANLEPILLKNRLRVASDAGNGFFILIRTTR